MCMACQMEDELWFAYLEQVAQQDKKIAAEAPEPANPAKPERREEPVPEKPAKSERPASPFACEELPSE